MNTHPLLQRAAARIDGLHWQSFAALEHGPRLLVLGAVHGNETCGAQAIAGALDALHAGHLRLVRGLLTLVPVCNPRAFAQGTREGTRNLNRHFVPLRGQPQDDEDRITGQLLGLLRSHDVLLDLHSFHTPGQPFAMVGPRDNTGAREPFARAREEQALARALGVSRVIEGWLEIYDQAARARGQLPDDQGIGTNEAMRAAGGYAVTLECGQHADPAAIAVARRAIDAALAHLGMADLPKAAPYTGPATRLCQIVLRESPHDRLAADWHSFDTVKAGTLIGQRANGQPVTAPFDAVLLFPHPQGKPGDEWFYLGLPG